MNSSERLKGIDVFTATVAAGSFTAAAERLNLTSSAVGKSIARLELRLNTRLFERTTRKLHLTDAGIDVSVATMVHSRNLDDFDLLEELVKELAGHVPLRMVFRDNGFVSDAVKINVEQIFRQLSPNTDIKSI